MPQTSDEHRARWPGWDTEAIEFLEGQGYVLGSDFTWNLPSSDHEMTEREKDAVLFLILEFDFGGTNK